MKLNSNGSVKLDNALLRRTGDDRWMVTMGETVIGYAHDIAEATAMVDAHKRKVRDRLAAIEAKREQQPQA